MDRAHDAGGSGTRASSWIAANARLVVVAAMVVTAALAVPMLAMAPDTTASQAPGGEVVETDDLVSDRFASDVFWSGFVVEARDGNVLAREPLVELLENSAAVRADPGIGPKLISYFDADLGADIDGIYTIADAADARLRAAGAGGLAAATDDQVAATIGAILGETAPLDWSLSAQTSFDPATGTWRSPALMAPLLADNEALGGGSQSVTLGSDDTTKEEFSRDAQEILRGGERTYQAWGVAIDVNLTVEEQAGAAGPFIGFTILAVLVVAGIVLRSYWVVAVAGAALAALMVWLKGLSNLIGLETDMVLSFIVPIAMISFGIDFAFHAIGRYREEAALGYRPRAAFVIGLGGVMGALVLALASDSVAFLSNVSSGIESVTQFGIGAALALVAAFAMLGIVTPLVVMRIDATVGEGSGSRLRAVGRALASAGAATGAMAVVILLVYLSPVLGIAALAVFVLAFVAAPYWFVRRRRPQPGAATGGRPMSAPVLGQAVVAMARRRALVLPTVVVVTALAVVAASRIEATFDVKDFFAADTDLVVSLDKLDEHLGRQGGEPAIVYVEADLTRGATLDALDRFTSLVERIDNPQLAVDDDGATQLEGGVLAIVDDVMASPFAMAAIGEAGGVAITDSDRDGLPDTPEQLAAVYRFVAQWGVPFDAERLAWTPDDVGLSLWMDPDGAGQATIMMAGVVGSRSQENIAAARADLAPLVDRLEAELQADDPGARTVLTGSAVVRDEQLSAIFRALLLALPISVVACFAVGALFMRSLRYALVSIVPILVVVSWLYAFMHLAGHGINIVTATIGAVSIGIGIDFAIHFIMRYREELGRLPTRLEAMDAAGTGTGAALAASALSSMVGFAILALAPMPLFAVYGMLTAVMIFMALLATLVVLPGLLMLTTDDRPVPAPGPTPEPLEAVGSRSR